jgi:hypothetical protein
MRYLKGGLTVLFIICIVSCTSKRREMVLPELPLYSLAKGIYEDPNAFKGRKKYIASLSGKQTKTRLKRIQPAIKNALEKGLSVVVYINSNDSEKVMKDIEELNFIYPVVIDKDGLFKDSNGENPEMGYNGYIVNKNNEFIGSPIMRMN